MKYEIIELHHYRSPESVRDFLDAMSETGMHYNSESLRSIYRDPEELEMALARAMRICNSLGIPISDHFRLKYIHHRDQNMVEQKWLLSKTAYCLTLLNGRPENPMVGRIQWELISRMI